MCNTVYNCKSTGFLYNSRAILNICRGQGNNCQVKTICINSGNGKLKFVIMTILMTIQRHHDEYLNHVFVPSTGASGFIIGVMFGFSTRCLTISRSQSSFKILRQRYSILVLSVTRSNIKNPSTASINGRLAIWL